MGVEHQWDIEVGGKMGVGHQGDIGVPPILIPDWGASYVIRASLCCQCYNNFQTASAAKPNIGLH